MIFATELITLNLLNFRQKRCISREVPHPIPLPYTINKHSYIFRYRCLPWRYFQFHIQIRILKIVYKTQKLLFPDFLSDRRNDEISKVWPRVNVIIEEYLFPEILLRKHFWFDIYTAFRFLSFRCYIGVMWHLTVVFLKS